MTKKISNINQKITNFLIFYKNFLVIFRIAFITLKFGKTTIKLFIMTNIKRLFIFAVLVKRYKNILIFKKVS